MKKKIFKISTLLMASLMLFTNLALSFTLHMCDGEVEKISFFDSNVSCEMKYNVTESNHKCCNEKPSKIHNTNKEKLCFERNECCENITIEIVSTNIKNERNIQVNVETTNFLVAFYYSYFSTFNPKINRANYVLNTKLISPPNRQILYQSFLI